MSEYTLFPHGALRIINLTLIRNAEGVSNAKFETPSKILIGDRHI